MTFSTSEISPLIGTRVVADKETLLSGRKVEDLRTIWEQRGVLVFPGIGMSDEEQLAFAATLGEPIELQGSRIYKVTLDVGQNATADYLRANVLWHFDGFSDDMPARGTLLSGRTLSPVGGQTEFANTYAAYSALSEDRKQALEGLQVVHTLEATQRSIFPDPSDEMRAGWAKYPAKVHPLVWTHRSGRKSLLLGSSMDSVEGMELAAGRALLRELLGWAIEPQFVYRHEWSEGDMVLWDNCGTIHRVEPFPDNSGRMMHRVTLQGEEAVAA